MARYLAKAHPCSQCRWVQPAGGGWSVVAATTKRSAGRIDIDHETCGDAGVGPAVGAEMGCLCQVYGLKPPRPLRDAFALEMSRDGPLVDAEEGGERGKGVTRLVLGYEEVDLTGFEAALRTERDRLTLARDVREYLRCPDDLVEAVDGPDRPANLCTKV